MFRRSKRKASARVISAREALQEYDRRQGLNAQQLEYEYVNFITNELRPRLMRCLELLPSGERDENFEAFWYAGHGYVMYQHEKDGFAPRVLVMSYSERLIHDVEQFCEGQGYATVYTTEQSNPGPTHYVYIMLS